MRNIELVGDIGSSMGPIIPRRGGGCHTYGQGDQLGQAAKRLTVVPSDNGA